VEKEGEEKSIFGPRVPLLSSGKKKRGEEEREKGEKEEEKSIYTEYSRGSGGPKKISRPASWV